MASYSHAGSGHPQSEVYNYGDPRINTYNYISDGSPLTGEESNNFWSHSPRSNSPTPDSTMQNVNMSGPYSPYFAHHHHHHQMASRVGQHQEENSVQFIRNSFSSGTPLGMTDGHQVVPHNHPVPFVRVAKRRTTANKKERRRTQSINNAYDDLRALVNVPPDTKLSKIKTLRLATSYINYLVKALESNDAATGSFNADLSSVSRKSTIAGISNNNDPIQVNDCSTGRMSPKLNDNNTNVGEEGGSSKNSKKSKRRTGWPQHVWALELEHHQAL